MKVLDLFSGIGGFSLGLERAGMQTVAFCEIDPYCRAVLRKHWPTIPCFEDVRSLHASDVGSVDVICGGFPCQDISIAGKGAGIDGARSGLWSEFSRLIGEIRPRYVIVENVAVLLGRGFDRVLGDLAALGFDAEWHCIPASAVGAPHRRDRLWIISNNREMGPSRGYTTSLGQQFTQRRASFGKSRPLPWRDAYAGIRVLVDGLPEELDEIGGLGNAVVPQIPEIIGRAIMSVSQS